MVADGGAARLIGWSSLSHDLVDVYASREHPEPYAYRRAICARDRVANVIAPDHQQPPRDAGLRADGDRRRGRSRADAGLLARHRARDGNGRAQPGERSRAKRRRSRRRARAVRLRAGLRQGAAPATRVLLAGFGSGCDALVFEMTGPMPGADRAARGCQPRSRLRRIRAFPQPDGALDLDWGVRSEFEQKAQATVLERYGRDMIGFIGGRDTKGNVQFPKSRIPVRPDADGPEPMAGRTARRRTRDASSPSPLTASIITPDPPFWFGLAQFDNGARVMMEFTDADARGFSVGDRVRMRLRDQVARSAGAASAPISGRRRRRSARARSLMPWRAASRTRSRSSAWAARRSASIGTRAPKT